MEIERSRPVSMGLWLLRQSNAMAADPLRPEIHIIRMAHYKTNVVDHLDLSRFAAWREPVERQIVLTRSEVGVVFVGHPFNCHAENSRIEVKGLTNITNVERHMPEAQKQRVH